MEMAGVIAASTRVRVEGQSPAARASADSEPRAWVAQMLSRRPSVGMAVGVVRHGSLEFFHGHGVADIESKTPITEETIFRIASITKTFTAIAVMQLWERGLLDLDAPANDYLRAYRLVPAKPGFRPPTVRHLLTHTSGIPEDVHLSLAHAMDFGESFELGGPVPTLAEYYRGGLKVVAEPGTRFVYTDHGFATAGQIVEDLSGMPLDRYFREHIFEPLGMRDTDLNRSDEVEARLAIGYTLSSHGAKEVIDREWVTAAASSIYSSPRDMARYAAALMGGGANEHGRILKPATLAKMFEPHYQPDPRVPGIGLAFDRFNPGGHLVIGHEGVLPGFNSQIFVAPDDGLAVMAFTNGAAGAMLWLPAECAGLMNRLLGVKDDVVRTDVPQHPEIWSDLCGWYSVPARLTDVRARLMMGAGAEVFIRGGRLMVRVLSPIPMAYRGFVLHPDDEADPDVFRIDLSGMGIGTARVIFGRDADGVVKQANLDLMPMALHKQPAAKNPRRWVAGALGVGALAAVALAVTRRRMARRSR
jgi:CubicO group peptidase (beta-lactamase class C family)